MKLLFSVVMVVIANLVIKWAMSVVGLQPLDYMIFEYAGMVLGGLGFVYGRGMKITVNRSQLGWGVLQGIVMLGSYYFYIQILASSPLSLVSIMRRISVVLGNVVMGLYWFGERKNIDARQRWLLGLGGLVLVMTWWVNG